MGSRTGEERPVSAGHLAEARERILLAAEKLFAEKGFAGTRVQEITDAAGVNKALLYYYFEDKQSVYDALLQDGISAFEEMLETALSSPGSYAERLEQMARQHVTLLWKRPNLLRVVQRSQIIGDVEPSEKLAACWKRPFGSLVQFFRQGIEAGEFDAFDPHFAAVSFLSMGTGFANHREKLGEALPATEVSTHIARLLLRGFLREKPD